MNRLLQFARFALGLVIFVLVLELCARVDDFLSYGAPFWDTYDDQILYVRDNIGKWGRPGARYQKWQLNNLGYRGPELRPGGVRIVCLGSSETFGQYEAPGEEYPRQLERKLNARFGRELFQVVNAAYPGETLGTATRRLKEIVEQVHPAYAIIYPSVATYIWSPPTAEGTASSGSGEMETKQPERHYEWRIAGRLRNLLKEILPTIAQTYLRDWQIKEQAREYSVMERIPEENVIRFRRDLSKLLGALRGYRVEPILVTHATAFGKNLTDWDRDLLIAWRKFYPMLNENGFIDMEERMNDAIRNVATGEHVLLIDAADEIPPGRAYFADFSHFTSAGAEIMASRLADGLQPLIDSQLRKETSAPPRLSSAFLKSDSLPPVAKPPR